MGIERDPLHHGRVLHLPEARSLLGLQLCICRMTPPPPRNSPHPPPAIRENLIDAHVISAHHPSTPAYR